MVSAVAMVKSVARERNGCGNEGGGRPVLRGGLGDRDRGGDCNVSSNSFGLRSWCNEIVDLVVRHHFFLFYINLTATSLFHSVQMAHGQKDTEMEKCAFSESKRPVNIDRNMLRNKF